MLITNISCIINTNMPHGAGGCCAREDGGYSLLFADTAVPAGSLVVDAFHRCVLEDMEGAPLTFCR